MECYLNHVLEGIAKAGCPICIPKEFIGAGHLASVGNSNKLVHYSGKKDLYISLILLL